MKINFKYLSTNEKMILINDISKMREQGMTALKISEHVNIPITTVLNIFRFISDTKEKIEKIS